ncbi:hypothetical protein [uncultured Faecalibaculum sp.]|uniref:hypothetical protein n=1 Tax=uncultured Faecalibaculum sp. TaxID=1729681 RepID=UPI0025FAAE96|nr:hypothetical protein [uncultured Faecalibaculum sp.]
MQDDWLLLLTDALDGSQLQLWISPGLPLSAMGITWLLDLETRRILDPACSVRELNLPFAARLAALIE